jgi:hypothetical protein
MARAPQFHHPVACVGFQQDPYGGDLTKHWLTAASIAAGRQRMA